MCRTQLPSTFLALLQQSLFFKKKHHSYGVSYSFRGSFTTPTHIEIKYDYTFLPSAVWSTHSSRIPRLVKGSKGY